jgi:phage N-6-adenine-methyltransferase
MNRHTPMLPEHDIRETPPELFTELNREFRFDLDACATHDNALCPMYCTTEGTWHGQTKLSDDDGLTYDWAGRRVFWNPPFSDIQSWLAHAWLSKAELSVGLIPATRTEQSWWHDLVEPYRDGKGAQDSLIVGKTLTTRFLRGRTNYLENGKPILRKNADGTLYVDQKSGKHVKSGPKFGSCLLILKGV